jgi:hypothetical protein
MVKKETINNEQLAYYTWPILVGLAKRKKVITYKNLAEKLEPKAGREIHHRAIRHILHEIYLFCEQNKLPLLTILIINKGTNLPGNGIPSLNIKEDTDKVNDYDWTFENPFEYAKNGSIGRNYNFFKSNENSVGEIEYELELEEQNEIVITDEQFIEPIDFSELEKINVDSTEKIIDLEAKMKNQVPEVKLRISKFIERGTITTEVKKIAGYKCLICEELDEMNYSFSKINGERYVETHHVEPVSLGGSLGISNLITVCANHHRQLHFGNAEVIENTKTYFTFRIDKKEITIAKITQ